MNACPGEVSRQWKVKKGEEGSRQVLVTVGSSVSLATEQNQ